MLDEREVHADQLIAQLRVLRAAVLQLAQLDEHRPRAAAVLRVVLDVLGARPLLRALHALHPWLVVSLVLAHSPARHQPPPFRGRARRGTLRIPLPVVLAGEALLCVLRVRPGLFGDAVDAFHRARPVEAVDASGGKLPCAALFVPHRPVRSSRRPGSRAALFVEADRNGLVLGDGGVDLARERRQDGPRERVP